MASFSPPRFSLYTALCSMIAAVILWNFVPPRVEATPSEEVPSHVLTGGSMSDETRISSAIGSPQEVFTSQVHAAPESEDRWFYAVTRSVDEASASFVSGGRVLRIDVREGDRVEAGQAIAWLDSAPMRNGVAGARAEVGVLRETWKQAKRDADRAQTLASRGGASREEAEQRGASLNALRAQIRGAQARTREMRRQVSEAVLRAPCAGVVSSLTVEPGEVVAGGQPVVWVHGDRSEVEVRVPASVLRGLQRNQNVGVRLDLDNTRVDGVIDTLVDATQRAGLFSVVVALPEQLRAGRTVAVALPKALPKEAWLIPVDALVRADGFQSSVFVVRDEHVQKVSVRPHTLLDRGAVVLSEELHEGDAVVTSGLIGLVHGAPVLVGGAQ